MNEESTGEKVIVVTEAGGYQRRYRADGWDADGEHRLTVGRTTARSETGGSTGRNVAEYAPGAWLSAREDGAEVPDSTVRALGIAKRALERIARTSGSVVDQAALHAIATDALGEIFTETE